MDFGTARKVCAKLRKKKDCTFCKPRNFMGCEEWKKHESLTDRFNKMIDNNEEYQ